MSEYQHEANPNGGYKIAVTLGALLVCNIGLLAGMTVAWWTAVQARGVTQTQLEDYVDKHSPYLLDKGGLSEHNRVQDEEIGTVKGKQERVIDRLNILETNEKNNERDLTDCRKQMQLVADYMEEQRKGKK